MNAEQAGRVLKEMAESGVDLDAWFKLSVVDSLQRITLELSAISSQLNVVSSHFYATSVFPPSSGIKTGTGT